MSPKQLWRMLQAAVQAWNQDNAARLAAALAYYATLSIAPLLILVIAIASLFFDSAAVSQQLITQLEATIGNEGAQLLQTALDNANRPGQSSGLLASLIGVGILLVGATGVLVQLQASLNLVWGVKTRSDLGLTDILRKRLLSLGMILGIGIVLLLSLVASSLITGFSNYFQTLMPGLDTLVQLLNFVVSFAITTLLFAMIFKILPDVDIHWGDVWFGGVVTALLFSIGKYLIGLYLGISSVGSIYGAAGSIVILLIWIFYSAQIMFFGAELTQVYAHRFGSQITPNEYAVPQSESTNG